MILTTSQSADDLPLTVSWFPNHGEDGKPAIGDPETTTWGNFTSVFWGRREGEKNGPNVVPARFHLERGGRQVRRKKENLAARTAIALDIETSKKTGEVPPAVADVAHRVATLGLAAVIYTSHSHGPADTRYRVMAPLSAEIDKDLPAPEIIARELDLYGVLDTSKIGAASLFYLPSCPYGRLDDHETIILPGAAIDATWIVEAAGGLLAERQAEADRIAADAHAEAARRRQAKLDAGFDPDDSLIEKLRSRFDLDSVLRDHGYDKEGTKYRHPNSSSGQYGADIKAFGGVERVFSHNATDPLHADNLPDWCDVKAIDAFDAVVILDFGCNRKKAMVELAQRFGLTKAEERKALAGLMFRMIRAGKSQAEFAAAVRSEGDRLGLTVDDVRQTAHWVAAKCQEAA